MGPKEAIETIYRMYKGYPTTDQLIALEEAYKALGKMIPRRAVKTEFCSQACPECGHPVDWNYCKNCGQKIQW